MLDTQIKDVSKTAIWTLRARAEEHTHPRALFSDPKAVEWMAELPWISEFDDWYSARSQTGICVRTRAFDDMAVQYLSQMSQPLVVELGCGLSSRYHRIGRGISRWIDLDLPEMIDTRRELDPETEEHTYLASSVLDNAWMEAVFETGNTEYLFIAEGLLMYFDKEEVLHLLRAMAERFPGAILLFDTQGPKAKKMNIRHTSRVNAPLKWVVKNPLALSELPLTILQVSTLFSCYPKRIGWWRLLNWIPNLRNINLFVASRLPHKEHPT